MSEMVSTMSKNSEHKLMEEIIIWSGVKLCVFTFAVLRKMNT